MSTLKRIAECGSWKHIPIAIGPSAPRTNHLIEFEELDLYSTELLNECEDEEPAASIKTNLTKKKIQRIQQRQKLKEALNIKNVDSKQTPNETKEHKKKKRKRKAQQNNRMAKARKTETKNIHNKRTDEDDGLWKANMVGWSGLYVPSAILRALNELGFKNPMPIQSQVLPAAIIERRDILGAAETGSGKTLAFGIPLLHHIMEDKARNIIRQSKPEEVESTLNDNKAADMSDYEDEDFQDADLLLQENDVGVDIVPALILAPTRELAIQVANHLTKAAKYTDIRLVNVVGGMAPQKQIRLLNKKPDIIVATPGRLWELIDNGHPYLNNIHSIRYLVIDEADRMLEHGHFEELSKILEVLNIDSRNKKRQTFVFSATLTTVHTGPERFKLQRKQPKESKLEKLMKKIGVHNKPHIVDLTTKKMTSETLTEAKIICQNTEKDYYLYYFIKSFPGRTLIFTNSIDCIFRLSGLFEALKCNPFHIHAKMQQRQRLKHLERFHENDNAVMFASDVAARGLDIPDVKHVIHYQTPRTMETYIHRSGRSARSGKEGFSLMLVSPEELHFYKRICKSLHKEDGVPTFSFNEAYMAGIRKRVNIARDIDAMTHQQKKIRLHNSWFSKTAQDMDMDLDDDVIIENKGERETSNKIKAKKAQLTVMMENPIFPKGFTGKFITQTNDLPMQETKHENLRKKSSRKRLSD